MIRYAWQPTSDVIEQSNITAQMRRHGIVTYEEFLRRSCDDADWFWKAFFGDVNFEWMQPYQKTVDVSDGKAWAQWFVGGRLNWTYNALDAHVVRGDGGKIALRWEGEEETERNFTYEQLLAEVNKLSNALLRLGVHKGDRIALWLPFIPEVAIGLLAAARIGAIVVPVFSGYGPEPAAVRLNDSEARFLITVDGFFRKNKIVSLKTTADEALKNSPSVEKVIVVKRAGTRISFVAGRDIWYEEIVAHETDAYTAKPFDADTPYMLIYTSGTTGKPKGAVHVHAGFPVKSAQDMFHVFDVKPADTVSWLTDIGWMMGPWLIGGGLILGASVFMYDGAPDHPAPDRLWRMVERHGVSVLGITPTLIRALMKGGERWTSSHFMQSLRILGSTGEPWNPEAWLWTLKNVGKDRVPIINYSGGTEISGGILGCVTIKPLKPCSFNSANPGVAAECLNEQGAPVVDEIGYLAITNVNPGMTRGFWRDPARYEETYWSHWNGVWYHGDLVQRDNDGFWFILGRADDTLKIAGKRIGPAEIESVIASHQAIVESAVIGVPDDVKGQAAVAFVVLKPTYQPDEQLTNELTALVTKEMGKPFAPKAIVFVGDLPKTRNAKVMRRVIRSAYLGEDTGDISSLENPQAVEEIGKILNSEV